MKLFFSYNFDDEKLVRMIAYHISKQPGLETYCYGTGKPPLDEVNRRGNRSEAITDNDAEKADKDGIVIGSDQWREEIGKQLRLHERFVFFVGNTIGDTQAEEALIFLHQHEEDDRRLAEKAVVVDLPKANDIPDNLRQLRAVKPIEPMQPPEGIPSGTLDEGLAIQYAAQITERLIGARNWIPPDDIPIGYPFDYEKDIIKAYSTGLGYLSAPDFLERGCPERWPSVDKIDEDLPAEPNPIPEEIIGGFRSEKDRIIVDARSRYHCRDAGPQTCCLESIGLTFPEAGPRAHLVYPLEGSTAINSLKVGILVSGGIAPGINAVIKGIVDRHTIYRDYSEADGSKYDLTINGYRDGFFGLFNNRRASLTAENVRDCANQGGSLLGTSRYHPLLKLEDPQKRDADIKKIINNLNASEIDILYVIGGDGSMRAAHMLSMRARLMHADGKIRRISVVAIPKTMDNDILWVWQSFGFMSAVEKAKQFVLQLHTEASSNPRLGIMQLFGSDSGFVVTHAALASGVCDYVLIPEVDFSMKVLIKHITEKLPERYKTGKDCKSPFGIILMAETAIPQDIENYVDLHREDGEEYDYDPATRLEPAERQAIEDFVNAGRRVQGQTHDALRRGGIKIISRVIEKEIRKMTPTVYWENFRVFTNEPRHLIRAIDPSVQDVIFGQRLGTLAVDNAMAGYTDFMISQWLTEYVLVPLKLVVMGRKRVPKKGIFWQSVVANTGQPHETV